MNVLIDWLNGNFYVRSFITKDHNIIITAFLSLGLVGMGLLRSGRRKKFTTW